MNDAPGKRTRASKKGVRKPRTVSEKRARSAAALAAREWLSAMLEKGERAAG